MVDLPCPHCGRLMNEEKHSIDKMIEEDEDNDDFNEMTAQLAEKITDFLGINADDDDGVQTYEDVKDIIRDHLTDWYENGDQVNIDEEQEASRDV